MNQRPTRFARQLMFVAWGLAMACDAPVPSEPSLTDAPASRTDGLYVQNGVTLWTANGNVVPVCWSTPGAIDQKAVVRNAIRNTWERYANIQFTEFVDCPAPSTNPPSTQRYVRARLDLDSNEPWSAGGGSALMGMGAFHDQFQGFSWGIIIGTQGAQSRLEHLGVHEFGHTLGFAHEMDRDDNPGRLPNGTDPECGSGAPGPGTYLTDYDRDSIMNYCNLSGNYSGRISRLDIEGAQAAYGPSSWYQGMRSRLLPLVDVNGDNRPDAVYLRDNQGALVIYLNKSLHQYAVGSQWASVMPAGSGAVAWLTGDANLDGKTDIMQLWNDNGQLGLILWGSTGSGYASVNPTSLLGSTQALKYLAVDVNNDGRTDIAELGAQPNGKLKITVHSATSNNVYQTVSATETTAGHGAVDWLTGDVDADGQTDIFQIWNNAGTVGIIVHKADGTGYVNGWATLPGVTGPVANSRFFVIDVDADGRSDVIQARNSGGFVELSLFKNDLTSTGQTQFITTWLSLTSVRWSAVDWLVGDTNLDGVPDLMQLWSDGGRLRVTLWRWNGSAMVNAGVTSTGISTPTAALSFHARDVDLDGRADIVQVQDDARGNAFVNVHLYNSSNAFVTSVVQSGLGSL
ncbi:FG-GAP-like repeat-containing protein [Corallococcus terminator]